MMLWLAERDVIWACAGGLAEARHRKTADSIMLPLSRNQRIGPALASMLRSRSHDG